MRGRGLVVVAIAGAAFFGRARAAQADITLEPPDVAIETLQRLLCEKEREGDPCGAGVKGEPLVCGTAKCEAGPCLLCMRAAVPSASPPPTMRAVRWPDEAALPPGETPGVMRSRRTWQGGAVALALATGLTLAWRRRSWARRMGVVGMVAALAAVMVGLVGERAAEDASSERREARRSEFVLLPVGVDLPEESDWPRLSDEEAHAEHLKRLLDDKKRDWRRFRLE